MDDSSILETTGIKIVRVAGSVAIASGAGYLISFIKAAMVAAYLGVGMEMDAFLWSFALTTLFATVASGPLSAVLVPVYLNLKSKGKEQGRNYFGAMLGFLFLIFVVLAIILILVTSLVTKFLRHGLGLASPELAVQMVWLMIPVVIFSSMGTACQAILNAEKSFFLPTLSNSIPAILVILLLLTLGQKWLVYTQPIGLSLGAGAQFILLAVVLWRMDKLGKWRLNWKTDGIPQSFKLLWPLVVTQAIILVLPIIDRTMAAGFSSGTISALGYAQTLMNMSAMVLLMALQSAILPFFADLMDDKNLRAFQKTFSSTIRILVILLLPISIVMFVLQVPIIRLVFERGAFDLQATLLTAPAFGMYLIGVVPMAITFISSRGFNAFQDSKTNAVIGTGLFFTIKLLSNILFARLWGYLGLALATSVAYSVTAIAMLWAMRRKTVSIDGRELLTSFVKVLCASLVAGGLAGWGEHLGAGRLLLQVLFGGGLAFVGFILMAIILKIEDLNRLASILWEFTRKRMQLFSIRYTR